MLANLSRLLFGSAPCIALVIMSAMGIDTLTVYLAALGAAGLSIIAIVMVTNRWSRRAALSFHLICLALIALVPLTHWPLRATFALSKSRFDEIADQLERGETVAPQWAGFFYIHEAELTFLGRMPVLWTRLGGNGNTGFGRPSDDVASDKFNEWSDFRLWGKWHHIVED